MKVDWLELTGFRSYKKLDWSPEPGVNILVGFNGAGKTNILEAIGFLSRLRSFRGAVEADLISDDTDEAVIRSGLSEGPRQRLIEIQLQRRGQRKVQVDKKGIRRSADLLEVTRVVTFLPDDLDLVKRGPGYRRDLLDDVAAQIWPAAGLDQAEYARALKQRNAFLRAGERDEVTLSVWDTRLAQAGGRVLARREAAIKATRDFLGRAYRDISHSGQDVDITYRATWGGPFLEGNSAAEYADEMAKALLESRRVDRDRRMTTVGPHRDEPGFSLDGADARTHGSQGEQRSMALAARIATHRAIAEMTSIRAVLLLDDVFSELDPERARALAGALPAETQTLITTARPEDVPLVGERWLVDGGVVRDG